MIRNVTESQKKRVAGRQRYTCAASISDYTCPMKGEPFDESGYEIDHIKELRDGGTNEESNLQALCIMCHRVKTSRMTTVMSKKESKPQLHECYHCDKLTATIFENDKWHCQEDCIRPCYNDCKGGCGSRSSPNPEVNKTISSQLFEKFRYKPQPDRPGTVRTQITLPSGKVLYKTTYNKT